MVSPLASVHPDAKLAGNVRIDAFAVVEHDTVLGDGTWIMSGSHAGAATTVMKTSMMRFSTASEGTARTS